MLRPLFQQIKKGKFKTFFLFLLLALFFWVLTKFSKEYTDTVKAVVLYKDIPENVTITGKGSAEINFDMKTNGFEFLYFKIKKPTVELDVTSYYKDGKNSISLSRDDLINLLNDQISNNNSVKNVYGNGIVIDLDTIVTQKLPVKVQSDIQYKEGYKSAGEIISVPDSVNVSGPLGAIENIKNLKTDVLKIENVDHNISEKIKIIIPSGIELTVEPDVVSVQIVVQEYTQKQLKLPIELIGVPEGQIVKLIPESINITFDVSIDDFNIISESDFKITCDFSERNDTENHMSPKIEMTPKNISNIVLGTLKIEYLIFK